MKVFNFDISFSKPNQNKLGGIRAFSGSYFTGSLGYSVDEFNLYSQIKDYRTDLLSGTNWRPLDEINRANIGYAKFIELLNRFSISIFNDYNKVGFAVFAEINGDLFYISQNNYTATADKVTVKGFSSARTFIFFDKNFLSGEKTNYQKCEPYQRLYNIALSCQKNGMSKSGYVNIISPKTPSQANVLATLTDTQIDALEKRIQDKHGISNDEQTNFVIFRSDVNVQTITYDFSKLGILETKKLCEEYVCSKLGVPFVLLPSSGQTFANYEEANKILYENHSKYCEHFSNFAKNELGFDIDYKTIAETGKGII